MTKNTLPRMHTTHSDGNGGYGLTKLGRVYLHAGIVLASLAGGGGLWGFLNWWHELEFAINGYARLSTQLEEQTQESRAFRREMTSEIGKIKGRIIRLETLQDSRAEVAEMSPYEGDEWKSGSSTP